MEGQPPRANIHSPKGQATPPQLPKLLHTLSLCLECFPLLFMCLAPPSAFRAPLCLHRELPAIFISISLGCSRFCYQVRLLLPGEAASRRLPGSSLKEALGGLSHQVIRLARSVEVPGWVLEDAILSPCNRK